MGALVVTFLLTIIAHGVLSDLKCWGCWEFAKSGTSPCNNPKNCTEIQCEKDATMCFDLVDTTERSMVKGCMSADSFIKDYEKNSKHSVILYLCSKNKCNYGTYGLIVSLDAAAATSIG